MADELIRVRLKSGNETNVSAAHVEKFPDEFEVLDEPVSPAFGRPRAETRKGGRPLLPATTVDAEATKNQAASKPADTTKG